MNPAIVLKDLLVSQGVGVFAATTGWGIFVGKMPDDTSSADTAIALINSGGRPPNPKWLLDYPSVQVMVRGTSGGYRDAWDKAAEVQDALLGIPSQDVTDGRLVSATAIGHINAIGCNGSNRPLFTVNFQLIVQPTASALTHRQAL